MKEQKNSSQKHKKSSSKFLNQNQSPRKMSSKSKPFLDLYTPEANNFTIPDLISHLQWTFLSDDFDLVANILSAREAKAKQDYALLEEKHAALWSWSLRMEDELKSCKEENVELRTEMLRAREEYESGIVKLRRKVKRMERDERKAETLVKLYQSRFDMLMMRVIRLEDDAEVLLMTDDQPRAEEEVRGTNTILSNASPMRGQMRETGEQLTKETACASEENKKDEPSNSKIESVKVDVKIKVETEAICKTQTVSDTIDTSNKMVLQDFGKESTRVVEIIDRDDEQPMGVKASFGGVDDDDSRSYCHSVGGEIEPPLDSNIKLKKLCDSQGPTAPIILPKNKVETPGTSLKQNSGALRSCEGKIKSALTSDQLLTQINNFARVDSSSDDSDDDNWKTETDMIKALEKDAQLSMKAICALYREKAFKVSKLQNTQNHEKSTALRGASLAEFLVNGDQRAKLKRSVLELQEKDEKGLHDCKRIAKVYSKKLFEIYEKDKGNFLPPFF